MGTQHSTLVMTMVDNVSGPSAHANAALGRLQHSAQHLKHTALELGAAYGLGVSLEKAAEYSKEAIESYAEQEALMARIRNTAKATPEEMEHAHHTMAGLSLAYATDIGNIEQSLLRLVQTGLKVPEATQKLEPLVRAAKAGHGDVEKLTNIMPRAERNFHLTGDAVNEFLGALVKTSEETGGGKDAFNQLAESAVQAGPLVEKWGWTGINGAKKWLSYVGMLTKELGDAGKAGSVMEQLVAGIGGTKTKAKFEKAFGKGFDIGAQTRAAMRRGLDPIKYYIDMAIEAERRGVKIFQSPELIEAIEAFKRRGGSVGDFFKGLKAGAKDAIPGSLASQVGTAEFKLGQLKAAWVALRNETGKGLIDAGVVDNLHRLMPLFTKLGEELGKFAEDAANIFEDIRDDWKGFMAVFDEGLSPSERLARFNKFLNEFKDPGAAGAARRAKRGKPGEHDEHGKPEEHETPAEHGPPPERGTPLEGYKPQWLLDMQEAGKHGKTLKERRAEAEAEAQRRAAEEGLPEEEIPLPRPRPRDMERAIQSRFPAPYDGGRAAGEATGKGFNEGLDSELEKATDKAAAFAAEIQALLNFSAGPTIAPQVEKLPGRHAGPAWLAKSRQRGSHYDSNNVPIE